jgi:class 3 adenylate cyclase
MGDGIMAFFGAPNVLANPSKQAVATAFDMVRELEELNAEFFCEGLEPLAIGIGIHTGEAVVGHVGASARHEYTAIGDAVNVASRLEGTTKECGFTVVCSREVLEAIGEGAGWEYLGEMQLKGHSPVASYGRFPTKGE